MEESLNVNFTCVGRCVYFEYEYTEKPLNETVERAI